MTIRKFSPGDDFDKYVEKMEEIFCAKNINDDKEKINVFLKSAGDECEEVLKDTVSEKVLVEMKFNQIIKILSKHFKKKKNVRAERHKFYTRKLRPNEELKDFIKSIKYLASKCDFDSFTDSMLCDKLIMSQKDVDMQNKLIEEPMTTKFDQMCKIALGEQQTIGYPVVDAISKDFEKMKIMENNKVQEKRNIQFEEILKSVNKFVTPDSVDRCQYTMDYNNIKNYIKDGCKRVCPTFKMMFKGDVLSGSCADNLKIIKPNEFDLIFQLELPLVSQVKRRRSSEKPGFLKINISKMLEEISKLKHYEAVYIKLLSLVDKDKFIVQQKVSSWMEGIMTEIIPKDGQIRIVEKSSGIEKRYKVHYTKCGPAHTLRIIQKNEFSIDFVPGFVFENPMWVAQRPCPSFAKNTNWHAVPKPDKTNIDKEPNIYFITSYISIESAFIENKQKLKNALRLLKKIRDNSKIELLKSYFIKTVFLWESTKQPVEFWTKNSLADVFMHMFEILVQYVQERILPSFWDENFDMFQKFTSDQMMSMCGQLTSVHKSLKKRISSSDSDELYKVFLTKEEMEELFKKM